MLEQELYPYDVTDLSGYDALVIAPHPDDESIGCGGTLALHVDAGRRVRVIFLTSGGRGDFRSEFGNDYVDRRRESAVRALAKLGVQDYSFWNYEDRELDAHRAEVSDRLLREVRQFSPGIIYVPSPFEIHPDHRAAFSAAWSIRRDVSSVMAFYEILIPLYPNTFVDITSQIEDKISAIRCYDTETFYNDYGGKTRGLNRFRTATLNPAVLYAEAYIMWTDAVSPRKMGMSDVLRAFLMEG